MGFAALYLAEYAFIQNMSILTTMKAKKSILGGNVVSCLM
jgi:predicted RND superfamily exporter protein